MNILELSPITVKFEKPINGWWDGGARSGGTFEPQIRYPDDPKRSFVKWGSFELNHWFTLPLHYERGAKKDQPKSKCTIMSEARKHLRKSLRTPATVI